MPDEKDKLIEEHIASLPQYVKDALKAAQPFEKIRKLVSDFHLHLDQGETLEKEVFLVMLGLSSPDTFIQKTSKSFGLTDEDSSKLVDRIVAELFMPIRESMRRYMEELAAKGVPEEASEIVTPQVAPAQSLKDQLSGGQTPAPSPAAQTLPKIGRMPIPEQKPISSILTVPAPAVQSAPATVVPVAAPEKSSLADIDKALTKPQASSSEKIDVGIAPAKPTYKVDPYLEPPV